MMSQIKSKLSKLNPTDWPLNHCGQLNGKRSARLADIERASVLIAKAFRVAAA
jgi:hypothetical protein